MIYAGTATSNGSGALILEVIVPSGETVTMIRSTATVRDCAVTRENNRVFRSVGMGPDIPVPVPRSLGSRGGLWRFVGRTANLTEITVNLYTPQTETDCP